MTDFRGMVHIPKGKFKMGSDDGYVDGKPVREIEISGFYLDQHEVTEREYVTSLAQESGSKFELVQMECGSRKQTAVASSTDAQALLCSPAANITWKEADAYCKRLGKRLPTEAEWERAAKGPNGDLAYATRSGTLNHDNAVYSADATANVCSKKGNYVQWGNEELCDMTGNVEEWVADTYNESSYQYMAPKDPHGVADVFYKVLRGGAWSFTLRDVLSVTFRGAVNPVKRYNFIGFRCASSEDSGR